MSKHKPPWNSAKQSALVTRFRSVPVNTVNTINTINTIDTVNTINPNRRKILPFTDHYIRWRHYVIESI